jgi:hypothetical protein
LESSGSVAALAALAELAVVWARPVTVIPAPRQTKNRPGSRMRIERVEAINL